MPDGLTCMGARVKLTEFSAALQWRCHNRVVRHGIATVAF
jgi:hypothetical protein